MASEDLKPLTHGETTPAEEAYANRYTVTDEMAQEMGFPNAQLYVMDGELVDLALEWHETHDAGVLKRYHALYIKMLELGMPRYGFDPLSEIDAEYMPELPDHLK